MSKNKPVDFFENFKGIICIFNSSDYIEYANKTFASLLGYNESDFKSLKITDLIVPDEKSAFFDMFYSDNLSHTTTVKFYQKSGSFRYFSIMVYNLGTSFIVIGNLINRNFEGYDFELMNDDYVFEDIFKEIETSDIKTFINEQSLQLRLILDLLPIDIWIKDINHKYIFANKSLSKHTGISPNDFLMKSDFDLFESNIASDFLASDQITIEAKKKISFTFEAKTKKLLTWTEVTKIPIYNKDSQLIGLIGYAVDVSDVKRIEKSLNDETSKLDFALEHFHGIMFGVNNVGAVVFCDGSMMNEFSFINKDNNLLDYFTRTNINIEFQEKLRLSLNGESTNLETHIEGFHMDFRFSPVYDDNGILTVLIFGNRIQEMSYEKR